MASSPVVQPKATAEPLEVGAEAQPFMLISRDNHSTSLPSSVWRLCGTLKDQSECEECDFKTRTEFSHECLSFIGKYLGWYSKLSHAQQLKRTDRMQRAVRSITIDKEFKHAGECKLAKELEDSGLLLSEVFTAVRWLACLPLENFVQRILAVLQVWIEYTAIRSVEWHTPPRAATAESVSVSLAPAVKRKPAVVESRGQTVGGSTRKRKLDTG